MRRKVISIGKGVYKKEPNYVYYWLYFIRGLAHGLIAPIYTIFLFNFGLNAFQVSLTNLAFILGNLFFQIPAGALADTWGRKKTFLASCLFNSLCFFVYGFGQSWQVFIIAEILSALGFVLATGILEAWAVDAYAQFRPDELGEAREYGFLFSRGETAATGASMLAGLAGGLIASYSLRLPFFIGGLVFLINLAMGYFLIEESWPKAKINILQIIKKSLKTAKEGTKEGLKDKFIWQIALYSGILMIGFKVLDMFWSKRFVDLAQGRVWVTGYIWVLMTVFIIGGNLLVKWWRDKKKDYLNGFIFITLIASLSIFLSSLSRSFYPAVFFFLFYEISRGFFRPSLFGYFNKLIKSNKRATVLSFTLAITWLGGALGLLILGWVAKKYSIEASWLGASLIILIGLVPILKLKSKS